MNREIPCGREFSLPAALTALAQQMRRAYPTVLKLPYRWVRERLALVQLRSMSISKEEYINDIKSAVECSCGYAAAKIGASQKCWMYYEIFLSKHSRLEDIRDYETQLVFHCLKQEGLFPESPAFYLNYNRFYIQHARNLDCLGVTYRQPTQEIEIIKHYNLKSKLIYYPLQEPDKSIPSNEANCYLPLFRDKRILLICPFADFLRQRASKEIYENVWSKTGKKWFYPKEVDAVEFPYGFSRETHKRYATVLDLFEEIQSKIIKKDFDVALVGAGGLAIPIVSYVKSLGRVGIDLGGALQFCFGVPGKRWLIREHYRKDYINEWWAVLPPKYRPSETDVCDNGAYW
jgi:hypothetical protein